MKLETKVARTERAGRGGREATGTKVPGPGMSHPPHRGEETVIEPCL